MILLFIYFIYFEVYTSDNLRTEMSAVRDLDYKMDSKDNINKFCADLTSELNKQLFINGVRVTSLIIKNFILINQTEKEA